MSLKKYAVPTHPLCSAGAVLQGENYRISMLTTALIRFEYSEDGKFEDHATQMVYNREFPVPEFRVVEKEETLDIYTKNLEIHYDKQKFTPGGLMVRVAGGMAGETGKVAAAAGEVPLVRRGHGAGLPYERQGCFLVPGHPHRKGAVAQSRRWKYHAGGHRRLFDYLPHGLVLPGL